MRRLAFSIIEIMIVLAAVAVLAVITVPRFVNFKEYALINSLDHLYTVCSYLQQKAISKQAKLQLCFDFVHNCYVYPSINGRAKTVTLSSGIIFGFIKQVYGPPSDPKGPISAAITFCDKSGQSAITFFPDGSISTGVVYITDNKRKIMVALTCSPSRVSYIRKYRYHNKKWAIIK